jgi:uncharacterized membrane protein YuzA (DUF378 family)
MLFEFLRKDFHDYHMVKRKMHKFVMILILLGAVNYLTIAAFRFSIIQKITVKESFAEMVYFIIGICALYIMFNRDTYLPFLGETIIPCNILIDSEPKDATKKIRLQVSPNSKVIYWASEPSYTGMIVDYKKAYGDFLNSGVASSNNEGFVDIYIREPQPYFVPVKGILEPHIHYRVCDGQGTLGRVKTIFLHSGKIF